jgi:hypothetical protein
MCLYSSRYTPLSFAIILVLFCSWLTTEGADEKKQITIVPSETAQQVNNHPWSYTTPGRGNTDCSGYGTVNGTAIDTGGDTTTVSGTVNTTTNCNTTYTPPQTHTGNRVTIDNAAWVTDTVTGDRYLIRCTANWSGSNCVPLTPCPHAAQLKGDNMWIIGHRVPLGTPCGQPATNSEEIKAKYHVLAHETSHQPPTVAQGEPQRAPTAPVSPSQTAAPYQASAIAPPHNDAALPCLSISDAREVLRLGRIEGYPDEEIAQAYATGPCDALAYLRKHAP